MHRAAIVAVLCVCVWTTAATAAPITVAQFGDQFAFVATFNSLAGVTANATFPFSGTVGTWSYELTIAESDGGIFGADRLHAFGHAQHVSGPHGEGLGKVFNFDTTLVAVLGGGSISDADSIAYEHQSHFDNFFATLSGEVSLVSRDITSYSLFLNGQHTDTHRTCRQDATGADSTADCKGDPELPEPLLPAMFALGTITLHLRRWVSFYGGEPVTAHDKAQASGRRDRA